MCVLRVGYSAAEQLQNILCDDFNRKEHEHNEDRRADDFHAVLHHETGADVVANHVTDGARDAKQEDGLAVKDKDDERGDVRRQVDDLGLAVCGLDAELREDGEGDDQEGAGAWAVEAIVKSDDECGEYGRYVSTRCIGRRLFHVIVKDVAIQDDKGGHRQDDQQNRYENLLWHEQAETRTDGGTDDGSEDGWNRKRPVDEAFADEANGCDRGAAAAGELVRADGVMRRKAGEEVRWEGNESSASADGVDEPGDENKWATDQVG